MTCKDDSYVDLNYNFSGCIIYKPVASITSYGTTTLYTSEIECNQFCKRALLQPAVPYSDPGTPAQPDPETPAPHHLSKRVICPCGSK